MSYGKFLPRPRCRVRVRAAFFAAILRELLDRFLAELRACFDSAFDDPARWPSRFRADFTARDRFVEVLRFRRPPFCRSRCACCRVLDEDLVFLGAGSLTPARRALESPMAIICLVDRAPCFPSRT